jgi:hypothetical protein
MKLNIQSTLFFCLLLISSAPSFGMQQGNTNTSNAWYNGLAIGATIGCAVTSVISCFFLSKIIRLKKEQKELRESVNKTGLEIDDVIEKQAQLVVDFAADLKKVEKERDGLKKLNVQLVTQIKSLRDQIALYKFSSKTDDNHHKLQRAEKAARNGRKK